MTDQEKELKQDIGLRSASALVVANIIGAGIFTTTGFQAADLGHPGYIFGLWILGGLMALCGALSFAELGAMFPQAGGEYVYIRETYGKPFGFMSAFVGLIAGFSAPIAAALKSLIRYLSHFIPVFAEDLAPAGLIHLNDVAAIAICWLLVFIHMRGVRFGLGFNDVVTLFKVLGILIIIIAAFAIGNGKASNFTYVSGTLDGLGFHDKLSAFATSLIFVSYCYLGWNASAYMAAEMKMSRRDLPRSLLIGTSIVIVLYILLNAVYFYGANVETLAGEVEVGLISARVLFGDIGVSFVSLVLSGSILASASAMTVVGPRVYYAFGKDFPPLKILARCDRTTGAPRASLILQGIIVSIIILSGRVDQIIQFAGFTLTLFAGLAVSCVIILRIRRPDLERPFLTWGYPLTPIVFLSVSLWTMIWAIHGRPVESILGLLTVGAGGIFFYAFKNNKG